MQSGYARILIWIGLAHMVERPVRTLLTVVGVALGVAAFVSVRTANVEVLKSFEATVAAVTGSATLEVVGGDLGIDETVISAVRTLPGILDAAPVVEIGARLNHGSHAGEPFMILGIDLLDATIGRTFTYGDGRQNIEDLGQLTAADTLFLGKDLAAEWGLTTGSRLSLRVGAGEILLSVKGIIKKEGGALHSAWGRMAIMDIAAAQKTFGAVGRLDRIEVTTAPSQPLAQVQEVVQQAIPPALTVQRPESRGQQVENMVRAFQMNLTVLSVVGLLVGVFLIYNTISFSVIQRRREIGIFRAIGMSERLVAILFVGEAATMGLLGGVLGAVGGVLVAGFLVGIVSRTVTDLYSPVTHAFITMDPGLWTAVLIEGAVLGAIVSALGAVGPSMDAGRTIVVFALAPGGYDVAQPARVKPMAFIGCAFLLAAAALVWGDPVNGLPVFGYFSSFCLLAGLTCFVPLLIQTTRWWGRTRETVESLSAGRAVGKIATEQIARCAGRSTVTVSALLVGVAIMVGVVLMVRSFRHTVELWIGQTVIADLIVAPHAWLDGTHVNTVEKTLPLLWEDRIRSVEGVVAVDTYRDIRTVVQGRSVALVSRDLRIHAHHSRYLFVSGDSSTLLRNAADQEGIVVSEVLAERLGTAQGRTLQLPTPSGIKAFVVHGVFYDYATDGGKIVMDRATYRKWWGEDTGATVFPVYLEEGRDPAVVRQHIMRRLLEYADEEGGKVPSIVSNIELRNEILDIFDRTFTLTYALEAIAILIAVLGIINTLVTSVLERRREFAILQAIGASELQIKLLVLWEASYLAAIGTFLGVVGGLLLSVILIKVVNKQSFGWTIQVEWTPEIWAQAAVIAAVVALLSGYWPARWATKQPIVDGLRYE